MAAASQPTLFSQAVSMILSSWSALNMAVEYGCGGSNGREKAQHLVSVIEDLFRRKPKFDAYDLAGFLEDTMDEEFDFLLEDGSEQMIAHHICQCFTLLREGHTADVEKFLAGLPNAAQLSRVQFAGGADSSDDEDEEEKMESPVPQPHCSSYPSENGHCDQTTTGTSGEPPTENVEGDSAMDVEEEDGWTVVKKGGRKR